MTARTTPAAAPPAIAAMGTALLDLVRDERAVAALVPELEKTVVVIIVPCGIAWTTFVAVIVGPLAEDGAEGILQN